MLAARRMMKEKGTVAAAVTEITVAERVAPLPATEMRFDQSMRIRHLDHVPIEVGPEGLVLWDAGGSTPPGP